METQTKIIPLKVNDNLTILAEANALGGEADVSSKLMDFQIITDTVEGIAEKLAHTLEKVQPNKASIEFSLELGVESGQLTALLVKGSGKGNLKVTLEWSK